MTTKEEIGLLLVLLAVAFVAGGLSWARRMIAPPPAADLAAIDLFVRNRKETVVKVEKLWFGGPGDTSPRSVPIQTGRPYKLLARASDGTLWTHKVATNCRDRDRIVPIMQYVNGGWQSVHY